MYAEEGRDNDERTDYRASAKEINEIEETITVMEKQIDEDTEKLLEASVKGDGEMIRNSTRQIYGAKDKIELLFNTWQP